MIAFTSMASIILPRALPWRKRQSRRRFGYVRMQAKHTSRALKIFIGDTSIMMALWRNWKLLVRASQTMREYSS
jgi:hypothetical protein